MKTEIFDDVVNFIVDKLPPDEIIAFRPSPRAQQRFDELTRVIKNGDATPDESAEMDDCIRLERMMQLAKARARAKVVAQAVGVAA